MKRIHFGLFILCILIIHSGFCQPITARGIVRNENGTPVQGALVSEFKAKSASATYTDSLGFFSLPLSQFAKLNISCNGYNDTLINVVNNQNALITLSASKTAMGTTKNTNSTDNSMVNKNLFEDAASTQTGNNNNIVYGGSRNYSSSALMPVFTHKEETKGSRYLFDNWMHGYAKDINGQEVKNSRYLFNYDKMEGGLLLTQDKQSAIEVDRKQIQSFTVFVNEQTPVVYENIPAIDDTHYVQLISTGSKYKIYKLTKTKFVKSNYHTDGMVTTGNPYDEYVDEDSYFVFNAKNNQMQKLLLKKKSIKETFAAEGEKLNKFLSEHSSDTMNETFLKDLGDDLNN